MIIFHGREHRYTIDTRAGRLKRGEDVVAIPPKEWGALVYLAERPNVLVTKRQLIDAVWGPEKVVAPATLTTLIKSLRRRLGDQAQGSAFIETAHGRGFRFVASIVGPAALEERPLYKVLTYTLDEVRGSLRRILGDTADIQPDSLDVEYYPTGSSIFAQKQFLGEFLDQHLLPDIVSTLGPGELSEILPHDGIVDVFWESTDANRALQLSSVEAVAQLYRFTWWMDARPLSGMNSAVLLALVHSSIRDGDVTRVATFLPRDGALYYSKGTVLGAILFWLVYSWEVATEVTFVPTRPPSVSSAGSFPLRDLIWFDSSPSRIVDDWFSSPVAPPFNEGRVQAAIHDLEKNIEAPALFRALRSELTRLETPNKRPTRRPP